MPPRAAQDLAKDHKYNFGDEIAYQLRLARKKKWNQIEERRIREEIELQSYLNRLIQEDKERQVAKTRAESAGQTPADVSRRVQQVSSRCDKYASELNAMFSQLDIRRKVGLVALTLCLLPLLLRVELSSHFLNRLRRSVMSPTICVERSASRS